MPLLCGEQRLAGVPPVVATAGVPPVVDALRAASRRVECGVRRLLCKIRGKAHHGREDKSVDAKNFT